MDSLPSITSDWESFSNFFREDWVKFFTETIPTWFQIGLEKVIGFFQTYFITPITSTWESFRDFFREDWVKFFTETIPTWFQIGLGKGHWILPDLFHHPDNVYLGVIQRLLPRGLGQILH